MTLDDQINQLVNNSVGTNEWHPNGVPSYWDWYDSGRQSAGNDPGTFGACIPWGTIYLAEGATADPTALVQISNLTVSILSKSTGEWTVYDCNITGGYYNEDFSGNTSTKMVDQSSDPGVIVTNIPTGTTVHFFADMRIAIDPADFGGVIVKYDAQMLSSSGDGSTVTYIANSGLDYWRDMTCGYEGAGVANCDSFVGSFLPLTSTGTTISGTTLDAAQLHENAPPAEMLGGGSAEVDLNVVLGVGQLNLTLAGTDDIIVTGNSLNNTINGNAGNNVIDGGDGADTMAGGAGNDTYVVDNVGDKVIEGANAGTDTVQSSVSYTIGANIENLTLTGTANINATGNSGNNVLTGNSGNNILSGGGGNDTFIGGLGADKMIGGAGNDTYYVDDAGDVVDEKSAGGAGTDIVYSSISFSLADTVHALGTIENLTLTGTANINATGNSGNNILTGNSGNNILSGGGGNDTFIGGLGADKMIGGAGNDTYYVDDAGDVVDEKSAGGAGTDIVYSSISFNLADTVHAMGTIENLTLTGAANINATGNSASNVITGNSGNNVMNGGGGGDKMIGGAGNDTYYVDNSGDVVDEKNGGGAGIDTVISSISFSLADTTHALGTIENLTLTGSGNLNATGNGANNTLIGNSGNNILNGGAGNDILIGGLGVDKLTGGAGSDTFVFRSLGELGSSASTRDVITDFVSKTDHIDLSGLDLAGQFLGTGSFGGHAGEIRQFYQGGQTIIEGDVNGDGISDFQIALTGNVSLVASDFIF